ncbi:MAG: hypothetical protein HY873_07155 [Chloroflexi bacterium]|nr:hypothetical protein [Chloroflexota bacterium]
MLRRSSMVTLLAGILIFAACGGGNGAPSGEHSPQPAASPTAAAVPALPQGNAPVELVPADFVSEIDNPYWPMKPGSRWVYNETNADGEQMQVEVTVTSEKKQVLGIDATVVRDVVTLVEDGSVKEDTLDWYAQDVRGNIWYLGEDTKEYEDGAVVSTAGSWEAGVDGAQAGVVVPASPAVGLTYRQEYYAGEAEDRARILSLDERVEVPYGGFDGCLQTEDTTPLDPAVREHKYYCRGVGPALAIDVASGKGREELVEFEQAAP